MQAIWSVLAHRAQVSRPTRVQDPNTGQWINTTEVVASNVRCRYLPIGFQSSQEHAVDSLSEATGTIIAAPSADIQPGDRVAIKGTTHLVLSRGSHHEDFHGHPSHQEWAVKQA